MRKKVVLTILIFLLGIFIYASIHISYQEVSMVLLNQKNLVTLVIIFSVFLSLQNIFTLVWMLYGWSRPENEKLIYPPKKMLLPQLSFTALIPARHEENVIQDTILAVDKMNYPEELKEILILVRDDDTKTIVKAQEVIEKIGKPSVRLITFDGFPINKPHGLNIGLKKAAGQIITIFDAEDEPHRELYNVVNTIMLSESVDIVQSGVQLMNYNSKWFSAFNVLEYYFWFKSGLHFFSRVYKVAPLGGNSVFFKKSSLTSVGGWDEDCLTEDADIGVRLAAHGSNLRVVYSEEQVTREETPPDLKSFVKQRTRWNQGFIQVLLKGDWLTLPTLRQKFIILYILLCPILHAFLLIYIPLGVIIAFSEKLPLMIALISYMPFYLMILQLFIYMIGMYKFTKDYNGHFSLTLPFRLLITYYPYQIVLALSAFRAIFRSLIGDGRWEKTLHINVHRSRTV